MSAFSLPKACIADAKPSLAVVWLAVGLATNIFLHSDVQAQVPPFEWVRAGGGAYDDHAAAIALNRNTNIMLAGAYLGTSVFGGVTVFGDTDSYYALLVKYDLIGSVIWARTSIGAGYGHGVTTDSLGNVIFVGEFHNTVHFGTVSLTSLGGVWSDIFIVKYDPNGNVLWAKRAGGPDSDNASGVVTDTSGNVYVTGTFHGAAQFGTNILGSPASNPDMFLAKLDSNGNFLWVKSGGGTANDIGTGIVLDQDTNIIVTGWFEGPSNFGSIALSGVSGRADMYVIKYDPDGNPLWGKQLGNNGLYTYGKAVAVDPVGNVFAVASAETQVSYYPTNGVLVKYDSNGNLGWSRNVGLSARSVAADANGNVYVTGGFAGTTAFGTNTLTSLGSYDIYMAKYSSAGTNLWAKRAGLALKDQGTGIALDTGGNVYVAGEFLDSATFDSTNVAGAGGIDIFLAKIPAIAPVAPTITSQPQSASVRAGSDAMFSVSAGGTLPLQYQWQFNNANLINATNSTLVIPNVGFGQTGPYRVIVSNTGGSVTSAMVFLSVLFPPSLASQPQSQVVIAGTTVSIPSTASGTPPLYYQWNFNGADLPLATNATLVISNVQPANFGDYLVVVSNAYGAATSLLASLTVRCSLTVSNDGHGQVTVNPALINYPTNLSVTLTATPSLGYAFSHWSGDAAGSTNPLGITMDTSKNILANFIRAGNLSTLIQGVGTVTKSPDHAYYTAGNTVTLTAIPGRWFAFARWGDGNTSNPRDITIDLSNSYTAIFSPTTAVETLTYNSVTRTAPVGMPAVFVDGELVVTGAVTRLGAAEISLLTTFPNGALLYTTDGSPPSFLSQLYYGPFTLKRSATVRTIAYSADFRQSWEADPVSVVVVPLYNLNNHTPGGGTINIAPANAPYTSNTVLTLTAAPAPGWTFLQWLGDVQGTNANAATTMTREHNVSALFGTPLATTVTGNGAIEVDPAVALYPYGTTVKLTGRPQPGNYFALWGNAASGTTNPLSFTITNTAPTVTALFAPLNPGQYALTVNVSGGGHVSLNPRANFYNSGQTVTLTAAPEAGQDFLGWSGDASGAQNSLTVTMNQSKTITANFTHRPRLVLGPLYGGPRENGFQLTVLGDLGSKVIIEGSGDLTRWTTVTTLSNQFGTVQFTDPPGTNAAVRYYRTFNPP